LQIKATNWPPANEIDASNGDLVVAITEVIARNMTLLENQLISPKDIGLNPKQLDMKIVGKRMAPPPLLVPSRCNGEEEGEGP
jgi:hypothetical protein